MPCPSQFGKYWETNLILYMNGILNVLLACVNEVNLIGSCIRALDKNVDLSLNVYKA